MPDGRIAHVRHIEMSLLSFFSTLDEIGPIRHTDGGKPTYEEQTNKQAVDKLN